MSKEFKFYIINYVTLLCFCMTCIFPLNILIWPYLKWYSMQTLQFVKLTNFEKFYVTEEFYDLLYNFWYNLRILELYYRFFLKYIFLLHVTVLTSNVQHKQYFLFEVYYNYDHYNININVKVICILFRKCASWGSRY